MEKGYGAEYYQEYDIGSKSVNYLESPELRAFLAKVAREVTAQFQPKTVLDAGCALGVLVAEFCKLGVDAYGLDLSSYAVANADPLARAKCFQGSLAEPFPKELPERFDLVTCIEVAEHMPAEDARRAIANLCRVTDTVVFCSTPDDFEDPTHVNVQQREYWAAFFAEHGFYDDLDCRPLYLAPYAVCYRRRADWTGQVQCYERFVRTADAHRDDRYAALEQEHEKAVAEWTRTAQELTALQVAHGERTEKLLQALEELNRLREHQAQLLIQEAELTQLKKQESQLLWKLELAEQAQEESAQDYEDLCQRYNDLYDNHEELEAIYGSTHNALVQTQDRVTALESSLSWRLMAPVRWVNLLIKRIIGRCAMGAFHLARRLRRFVRRKRSAAPRLRSAHWPPALPKPVSPSGACALGSGCKRLGIYTIYDQDGVVDDYILHFLKALTPWVEKRIVVSNGPLQEAGVAALEALGWQVLIRENRGFDAWGVKAGIEHIGFEALSGYDELIVANNTLFGPVAGLDDLFREMSRRKADFWGIAAHAGIEDEDPFECNPYGYIPEHIQSFFYGIRRRLLTSEAFQRFWTQLPELPNYKAAVGLYETVMTRYFSDAGFTWSTYMDPEKYYPMSDNPLIAMPMESIRDWGSPFFKRRAFFQDYDYLTTYTGQQSASCLMQYLQEQTDYPVEYVWQNLIRTCHMSDLTQSLHLARIFDRDNAFGVIPGREQPKAALFMHIYDHTMARELAKYAANLPETADIFISTVSQEKKAAIQEAFGKLPNALEIRVLPNRGRDVSALLTSFRDVVMNYDVACVTHDKKTGYLKPQTVGEGFAYMGYENILGSRCFVEQVIQEFALDPHLGLLYAPDPNHADFATHIGLEWGDNLECTLALAKELGLHVPMDAAHPPMAPYGSSFWFRTRAMEPLFAKQWTYEDFPPEPFAMTDGSILHAIERIYPYVAQHAGYYSALVATADYASLDIGNLTYYAQGYAHACFENGVANRFIVVRQTADLLLGPASQSGTSRRKRSLLRRGLLKLRRILTDWAYV